MRYLMKNISKSRHGFTLIEVMIAAVITAVLGTGITAVIYQIYSGNTRAIAKTQAIEQVENAGYWINQDAMMAQSVTTGTGSGFPLVLSWQYNQQGSNGDMYDVANQVTYSLTGNGIQRSLTVTLYDYFTLISTTSSSTTVVAQNINSDASKTNCSYANGFLDFQITATIGTATETRGYQINLRVYQPSS